MKIIPCKKGYQWETHSCVRARAYRYDLTISDFKKDLFPREMTGYFDSPVISALPLQNQRRLLAYHLQDFLEYTVTLEHTIVNPALQLVVTSELFQDFPSKLKDQAYQFYTDEGYHAYFSHRLSSTVGLNYCLKKSLTASRRITRLAGLSSSQEIFVPNEIICFLKAFASETLISKELANLQLPSISKPVLAMFKDHMYDEARHCEFFCELFVELHKKICLTPMIPVLLDILDIFFEVDEPNMTHRLLLSEGNEEDVNGLIASARTNLIAAKKERCTTPLRVLKRLGLFSTAEADIINRGYA
ncbi:diiron oxygenase [Pseudomonas sp. RIT-PI-S]|uniref:diiron oxygenase n=1 Tax=Pseudomonas sp. RIT-PI-S TaxID=3035295 RepID=UPI0021DB2EF8|nr:diiron oxygenase [Pseudomonas sp. RIT-PI-S]